MNEKKRTLQIDDNLVTWPEAICLWANNCHALGTWRNSADKLSIYHIDKRTSRAQSITVYDAFSVGCEYYVPKYILRLVQKLAVSVNYENGAYSNARI